MSATRNDERYGKFLELLPLHKYNVTKSAILAGFASSYAQSQQKQIMQKALKFKLERAGIEVTGVKDAPLHDMKRTMAEIVGFTREELMNNIKEIALQTKDYSTRLKVVAPLARAYGVDLSPEEANNFVVPVLNVTVREKAIAHSPTVIDTHSVIDVEVQPSVTEVEGGEVVNQEER